MFLGDRLYAMPYDVTLTKISEVAFTMTGMEYHRYETWETVTEPSGRMSAHVVALNPHGDVL